MKKILFLIPTLLFAFALCAQPPQVEAEKGMVFGQKISAEDAVAAAKLAGMIEGKEKTVFRVKGEVVEVCKAEGCWLRMKTDEGTMLIKMKDHAYLVPLSLTGKTIVAEGTATVKETSVDMLRHYAEDAGKSKEEIESITQPKKEIVMQASGVTVM